MITLCRSSSTAEQHPCKMKAVGSNPTSGSMSYDFYNSEGYKKRQSMLVKNAWKRGVFDFFRKKEERMCKRSDCDKVFITKPSVPKVFCSQSCAAIVNNTGRRRRKITNCLNCSKETSRSYYKYCCNSCQMAYQHSHYINRWKKGEESGLNKSLGIVSPQIKKYLREKYKNKCCLCGWSMVNPKTGKISLVAVHVDGNWQNNKEKNLRLICPNCDSLTPTYKNSNRGNGRKTRMLRINQTL